ncbi:MAG: PKD domain-containing protein [Lewinellaceae bacterium]|nr:PKD domain-containing protein [Lewinellaceae bacterium]
MAVTKNDVLVSDTMHHDGLHAVKHANGRDWWIVGAKQNSNKYYLLLLDPQGIHVQEQYVGVPTDMSDWGEIAFSPDGTKMARYNAVDDLRIFDFDRCTGTLFNPIHIEVHDDLVGPLYAGLCWSADSRYLYITDTRSLFQFDVQSSDIASSRILIAEAEPPACPLSGTIGYMELGPDGILYSRPFNGQNCMHRIKHPERAGTACEMEQNYYQFDYPYRGLPHFPNFRLGPIDGSPCDTLGLDNHPLANWRYDRTPGLGVDFTSVSWYEPTDWLWDFGDPGSGAANSSTEKHPSHMYPAAGPYEVCLTVSNQYGGDTKCKTVWVEQTTSLSPAPSKGGRDVTLYPNPTTGMVYWRGVPEGEPVTVRVFDALGRLRYNSPSFGGGGGEADLGALEDGLYFAVLSGRNGEVLVSKAVVLAKK